MAYTDDAVLSKLSALNESHDSIATAAQWIMFHRRHSERTVQLWLTKLKDLPSHKRLNMIYLANEVVQQSKARHKDDFLREFSPLISEATSLAYKGASSDIQAKLRRVVDVWRDRCIFDPQVQDAVEARLDELDKARSTAKVTGFSGSLLGSSSPSIPAELNVLVAPQQRVFKVSTSMKSVLSAANTEYEKLTDPAAPVPVPPVYAARLNGLMKTLANAEGAVVDCVKARRELIGSLEKILRSNQEALEAEEALLGDLAARKANIEGKKQEVELAIMRGLATNDKEQSPGDVYSGSPAPEPERPEVEALTPPHVQDDSDFYKNSPPPSNGHTEPIPPYVQAPPPNPQFQATFQSAPGIEMLSNLASQYQAVTVNGGKKRKIESKDDFPDLGGDDGIDADVAEMLRKDSRG